MRSELLEKVNAYDEAVGNVVLLATKTIEKTRPITYAGLFVGMDYEYAHPFAQTDERFNDFHGDDLVVPDQTEPSITCNLLFDAVAMFSESDHSEVYRSLRDICLMHASSWLRFLHSWNAQTIGLLSGERWDELGWVVSARQINENDVAGVLISDFDIALEDVDELQNNLLNASDDAWRR